MKVEWRREWDSNPRLSFPNTRFPSVLLKPLGHLSACCRVWKTSKLEGARQTRVRQLGRKKSRPERAKEVSSQEETNLENLCYTFYRYSGVVQLVARQPLELVILVRVQAPEPFSFEDARHARSAFRSPEQR